MLIYIVVLKGYFIFLKFFFENFEDVNVKDSDGWIVLYWVVIFGNKDVVEFFLKFGVNVNGV